MNQDIIYEILRHLYLEGHAPTAKKILICTKWGNLVSRSEKLEKPIVFEILGNLTRLPLQLREEDDFRIYWGDGTRDDFAKNRVTIRRIVHKYSEQRETKKIYKIKVFGTYEYISMPKNLHNIYSIGNITSLRMFFEGCECFNKQLIFDTSKITDMMGTFYGCISFNQPLKWNTSKVTDLSYTFFNCKSFDQSLDWDTSQVKDMNSTFYSCVSFDKSLNWDTRKVLSMVMTFGRCKSFNSPFGEKWNISNVIDMSGTFHSCKSFNQILNWDTSEVTNTFNIFENSNGSFV